MIVISESLVLSATDADFDTDNPLILWDNKVSTSNIRSADVATGVAVVEDPSYPTINMANPSTGGLNYFKQLSAGQSIFFEWMDVNNDEDIDCLAVAGHNFGDGLRVLQVYAATTVDGSGDPVYATVTQDVVVANNWPLMFRFTADVYIAVKLVMTASGTSDKVRAAVLSVGKLLICERKVQATFTPLPYGRKRQVTSGMSESGQFLGRNVVGQKVETSCTLAFMSPDWYRDNFEPFADASGTATFFFAWAPVSYPLEVGYAWLMNDAIPQISHTYPELFQITLDMQGIVE